MDKLFKELQTLNATQEKRVLEFINSIGTPIDKILIELEKLNNSQQERILDFIEALKKPIEEWINKDSIYVDKLFAEEFRSRIANQHACQETPLHEDSFDWAFYGAIKATKKPCEMAPGGARFWDMKIDQTRVSLKSTQEKALSKRMLKISKLTEGAWIQDCRTAERRETKTKELFTEYINSVDTIIQLRYFHKAKLYELVEIPIELFKPILEIPRSYFNSDGPTIGIPVGEDPPNLRLKLDRSDSKVTISSILKSSCIVHATWKLL